MKKFICLTGAVAVVLCVAFLIKGDQKQAQVAKDLLDVPSLTQLMAEEGYLTGTHFESDGIVVDSDSELTMLLESRGGVASMEIEPGLGSTSFSLSGLNPSTTYYLYKDNYHNLDIVTTDTFGSYTFSMDTSARHSVWIQANKSTVFVVRGTVEGDDCAVSDDLSMTVYGIWDGEDTCELTGPVPEAIQIDESLTLDCKDFLVSGTGGAGTIGILIPNDPVEVTDVTIKNCEVTGFERGFVSRGSSATFIKNTSHHNSGRGFAFFANGQTIIDNVSNNNGENGFSFFRSGGNFLEGNKSHHNIGRGYNFSFGDGDNDLIDNKSYSNGGHGFRIFRNNENTLTDNESEGNGEDGFSLRSSSDNDIIDNEIMNNVGHGINLTFSNFNLIMENEIEENGEIGILLGNSDNNMVLDNEIEDCGRFGILNLGSFNTIEDNDIENCPEGQGDEDSSS